MKAYNSIGPIGQDEHLYLTSGQDKHCASHQDKRSTASHIRTREALHLISGQEKHCISHQDKMMITLGSEYR